MPLIRIKKVVALVIKKQHVKSSLTACPQWPFDACIINVQVVNAYENQQECLQGDFAKRI